MKRCSTCNRTYEDSQSFCLEDGTALEDAESVSDSVQTQVLSRSKKSRVIPVVIALLLLTVAVAGWMLFRTREASVSQNNKQTESSRQIPTPAFSPTQIQTPSPSTPSPTVAPESTTNTAVNSETGTTVNSNTANQIATPDTALSPRQNPVMKIEDHQISFALYQCRKSGSSIACNFSLTNKGEDRRFRFVAYRSNLYDELGNGYNGRSGQIANQQGENPQIDFISGVTTTAQITFERIEPAAAKITLLRIQYDVGDDYGLDVKFRNVPLLLSK